MCQNHMGGVKSRRCFMPTTWDLRVPPQIDAKLSELAIGWMGKLQMYGILTVVVVELSVVLLLLFANVLTITAVGCSCYASNSTGTSTRTLANNVTILHQR